MSKLNNALPSEEISLSGWMDSNLYQVLKKFKTFLKDLHYVVQLLTEYGFEDPVSGIVKYHPSGFIFRSKKTISYNKFYKKGYGSRRTQ